MIAPTRSALTSDLGLHGAAQAARRWRVTLDIQAQAAAARPAPRPQPRPLAAGLDGLLTDGAPVRTLERARYAATAFTAGDGFLPGQIIDRSI